MDDEQSMNALDTAEAETSDLSDVEKLRLVAENFVGRDDAQTFINEFTHQLTESLNDLSQSNESIYQLETEKSDGFYFDESEQFITTVLSRQTRHDNFVTARVKKLINDPQGNSIFDSLKVTMGQLSGRKVEYQYILELNCELEGVEFKVTLTPQLKNLKQVKLCISFAPSIDCCFVFENALTYELNDWDSYSDTGNEAKRRWYKFGWKETENIPNVVEKISTTLREIINNDIDHALERANEVQKK